MTMSNWWPFVCPECHRLYVNRPVNTVIGMISMLISGIATVALADYLSIRKELAIILAASAAMVAYGAAARPMRFEELRMYTKRAWWEYPLFYVVLPLAVVLLGLLIALRYTSAI